MGSRKSAWFGIPSIFAGLLWLACSSGPSLAGELVAFPPLYKEVALAKLSGYLARPDNPGVFHSDKNGDRFPAVVLLHDCSGFGPSYVALADQLAAWGYVALAVDSLGPRDMTTACVGHRRVAQANDAYAALQFLDTQPFVDPERVALLGASMGAMSTLTAVERGSIEMLHEQHFRSAVAFFPLCSRFSGSMTVPTLVLIGELDDWTPAQACRDMMAGRSLTGLSRHPGDAAKVKLVEYPGTYHAFFNPALQSGVRYLGHWLEYNPAATRDANAEVHAFLDRTLGKADHAL